MFIFTIPKHYNLLTALQVATTVCNLIVSKNYPYRVFTKTKFMKTTLPFFFIALVLISFSACQRKVYTSASFDQQTLDHKKVAILPAQIIFTGKMPKDMRQGDIEAIERRKVCLSAFLDTAS